MAKWGGFTTIDVTVSGVSDENISSEWIDEGTNDTMMVLVKASKKMDLYTFSKFKCERRYEHVSRWSRRYFCLLKWIETQDKEKN